MMKKIIPLFICLILLPAWLDPYADNVRAGNKLLNDGQYEKALEKYLEAEKYLPSQKDAPELAFNKALAYAGLKDYDNAEENYRIALRSENSDIQKKAFYNLGNLYEQQGKIEEAVKAYINALRIDPSYEKAKKNLEYLLQEKKKDQNKDDKNEDSNEDNKKNNNEKDQKNENNSDDEKQSDSKNNEQNVQYDSKQMDNILKNYETMPVRRKKGEPVDGVEQREKDW